MILRVCFFLLVSSALAQLHYPQEKRLKNVRQLTFEGQNAEGYFSYDDNFLTLQATGYGTGCDQIYQIDLRVPPEQQTMRRLSTGMGVCTCSFFYPNNKDILYAGTFHKHKLNVSLGGADPSCPPKKCQTPEAQTDPTLKQLCNTQYTWDIYPDFDIFKVNEFGNVIKQLTNNDVYDAEGVLSPDGSKLLFTSLRSGDLELWVMNSDGTGEPKQLTNELGYDGGAFFSPDGTKIIFRASRPKTDEEIKIYKQLLSYNLVAPTEMELYMMNSDGTGMRTVFKEKLGGANWAPYYLPDNKRVIFATNFNSTDDDYNSFDLFLANDDGTGLEQVTFDGSHFDSFPMFSRSGKQLVWGSSRNGKDEYDLNLFIADWVDNVEAEEKAEKEKQLETNRVLFKKTEQAENNVETKSRWQDLETSPYDNVIHFDGEKHFANVKQLTFGGENAEGYFSFDDSKLTLQATGYGTDCDQIYELDLNQDPRTQEMHRISTGLGGTTCSFFFKEPDNNHRLYAGNFWNITASQYADPGKTCPPKKCADPKTITDPVLKQLCRASYTWDIVPDYDIFKVNKYGNIVEQLTITPGYDAEAVLSPDGTKIAFTSIRSGDLEIWIMDVDGKNPKQLTNTLGYDGGCFFSPDGKRLIFRASRPTTKRAIEKYKLLLSYDLVEPVAMELFVMDIDGSNQRQITHMGGANWAPYYLNDNKRVIFSSNYHHQLFGFGAFALYTIYDDGTGLERITFGDKYQFNAFAMMNYEGTKLVWGSSRNGSSQYELNLFIADWVDPPEPSTTTMATTTSQSSQTSSLITFLFSLLVYYRCI